MKTYVLDTNVLLNFAEAMYELDGHVIIPLTVINELDHQKQQSAKQHLKYMARVAIREIKKALDAGRIEIYSPTTDMSQIKSLSSFEVNDDLILETVVEIKEARTDDEIILVTNDFGLTIKAEAFKIPHIEFNSNTEVDNSYKGFTSEWVEPELLSTLSMMDVCDPADYMEREPYANEFIEFETTDSDFKVIFYYNAKQKRLEKIREKYNFSGIVPKNKEQTYLMHLLCNPNIPCVQVKGSAGSGKTLLSTAWAWNMIDRGKNGYEKMIYIKSLDPVSGHDIGFLPGSLEDKLEHTFGPLYDSLQKITKQSKSEVKVTLGYMEDKGKFETVAVSHIRGRSFNNTILILDESENYDIPTLRTLLTRVGEGCKIIILSDDNQIDNPKLSAVSNGTSLMKERLVGEDLYGYIELQRAVRSPFTELVNKLMV